MPIDKKQKKMDMVMSLLSSVKKVSDIEELKKRPNPVSISVKLMA